MILENAGGFTGLPPSHRGTCEISGVGAERFLGPPCLSGGREAIGNERAPTEIFNGEPLAGVQVEKSKAPCRFRTAAFSDGETAAFAAGFYRRRQRPP